MIFGPNEIMSHFTLTFYKDCFSWHKLQHDIVTKVPGLDSQFCSKKKTLMDFNRIIAMSFPSSGCMAWSKSYQTFGFLRH
jgi:hypothetical protein